MKVGKMQLLINGRTREAIEKLYQVRSQCNSHACIDVQYISSTYLLYYVHLYGVKYLIASSYLANGRD